MSIIHLPVTGGNPAPKDLFRGLPLKASSSLQTGKSSHNWQSLGKGHFTCQRNWPSSRISFIVRLQSSGVKPPVILWNSVRRW